MGLLDSIERHLQLPKGDDYGLDGLLLLMAFMALARLPSIEALRDCAPGECCVCARPLRAGSMPRTMDRQPFFVVNQVVNLGLSARNAPEPWLLVASTRPAEWPARPLVKVYRQSMQIELSFRDMKRRHFGKGLECSASRGAGR